MGCTASRNEISGVEHCLLSGEESLKYSTKNIKDIDNIHRKYSYTSKITISQFTEISTRLGLAIAVDPTDSIIKFYENFKIDGDCYNLNKLLVLGVLVSSGNPVDKARILFEIEDTYSAKVLRKESVQALINDILQICLEFLPSLYMVESDKCTEEKISEYVVKINQNYDTVRPLLLKEFMGSENEEISLLNFMNNFRVDETARLLRPYFIRRFVVQNSKEIEEIKAE